jgi:hypothetical protein
MPWTGGSSTSIPQIVSYPTSRARCGLRPVPSPDTPNQVLACELRPVDPPGVRRGLLRVALEERAARLSVRDGVRQRDMLPDELPSSVHVG